MLTYNTESLKNSTNTAIENIAKTNFVISPSDRFNLDADINRKLIVLQHVTKDEIQDFYHQSLANLYSDCVSYYFDEALSDDEAVNGEQPQLIFSKNKSGDIIAAASSYNSGKIQLFDQDSKKKTIIIPGEVIVKYKLETNGFELMSIDVSNDQLANIIMGNMINFSKQRSIVISFLENHKRSDKDQEKIDHIRYHLNTLDMIQTVGEWVELFTYLLKSQIEVYEENSHPAFADALQAVHQYLLNTTLSPSFCPISTLLSEAKEAAKLNFNDRLQEKLEDKEQSENTEILEEASIHAIALGHHDVLLANPDCNNTQTDSPKKESAVKKRTFSLFKKNTETENNKISTENNKIFPVYLFKYPQALIDNSNVASFLAELNSKATTILSSKRTSIDLLELKELGTRNQKDSGNIDKNPTTNEPESTTQTPQPLSPLAFFTSACSPSPKNEITSDKNTSEESPFKKRRIKTSPTVFFNLGSSKKSWTTRKKRKTKKLRMNHTE